MKFIQNVSCLLLVGLAGSAVAGPIPFSILDGAHDDLSSVSIVARTTDHDIFNKLAGAAKDAHNSAADAKPGKPGVTAAGMNSQGDVYTAKSGDGKHAEENLVNDHGGLTHVVPYGVNRNRPNPDGDAVVPACQGKCAPMLDGKNIKHPNTNQINTLNQQHAQPADGSGSAGPSPPSTPSPPSDEAGDKRPSNPANSVKTNPRPAGGSGGRGHHKRDLIARSEALELAAALMRRHAEAMA